MDKYYKWVKASEELPAIEDFYVVKYPNTNRAMVLSEYAIKIEAKYGTNIEWLKEVEPSNNWQDILKVMLDTHAEYLPINPITHEESEWYMYMAKRIARVEPLNVDEETQFKKGYEDGYCKGYSKGVNDAGSPYS